MKNDAFHQIPLRYGKTDGENLPGMPKDKYFVVGYNGTYGLVDVCEGNGKPILRGEMRTNIEGLLTTLGSLGDSDLIDSKVEDYIMDAYANSMGNQESGEGVDPSIPAMEVLNYGN